MKINSSIKVPLILLLFIIIATFTVYTFLYSLFITKVVINQNQQYQMQLLNQISDVVSKSAGSIENILTSFVYNDILQSYLNENDAIKKALISDKLDKTCISYQNLMKGIYDFVVISDSGNYYYKGFNAKTFEVADNIIKSRKGGSTYYSEAYETNIDGIPRKVFAVTMPIYKTVGNSISLVCIGYAAMIIDRSAFSIDFSKVLSGSNFKLFLVDRADKLYSQSDKGAEGIATGAEVLDSVSSGNFKANEVKLPAISGRIISLTNRTQLFGDLNDIRTKMIIIGLALGTFLIIVVLVIVGSILVPLNKFTKHLVEIKTTGTSLFKTRISLWGYAEIKLMADSFNNLINEIKEMTDKLFNMTKRLYETELEKKQAEIMQLRSQINPHFLYNTLEVCKGVAYDEDVSKVVELLTSLGSIFKYSVKGESEVSLKTEISIIESYIKIQSSRFGPRLKYENSIPQDLLSLKIPKMILQPIVENAVFHGLERRVGEGRITITGEVANNSLILSVHDNGVGFSKGVLNEVQQQISNGNSSYENNEKIGITNVNNRLKLMYGEEYGLEIRSMEYDTTISLKIPVIKQTA